MLLVPAAGYNLCQSSAPDRPEKKNPHFPSRPKQNNGTSCYLSGDRESLYLHKAHANNHHCPSILPGPFGCLTFCRSERREEHEIIRSGGAAETSRVISGQSCRIPKCLTFFIFSRELVHQGAEGIQLAFCRQPASQADTEY